jgi:hypothetical protein
MAETQEMAPLFKPDLEQTSKAVLEIFRSARPQDAFESAVRAYRQRNYNVPAAEARRAVARIICGEG